MDIKLLICLLVTFVNVNLSESKSGVRRTVRKRYATHGGGLFPLSAVPYSDSASLSSQLPATHYVFGHGGAVTQSLNVIYPKYHYSNPRKYFSSPLFGVAPSFVPSVNEILGAKVPVPAFSVPTFSVPTVGPTSFFNVPVLQPELPLLPTSTGLNGLQFTAFLNPTHVFNASAADDVWRPIAPSRPPASAAGSTPKPSLTPSTPQIPINVLLPPNSPLIPNNPQFPNNPSLPNKPGSSLTPNNPSVPASPQLPNSPSNPNNQFPSTPLNPKNPFLPSNPLIPNRPASNRPPSSNNPFLPNNPPVPLETLIPRPSITLLPPFGTINEGADHSFQGSGVNTQEFHRPNEFFIQGNQNQPFDNVPRYPPF